MIPEVFTRCTLVTRGCYSALEGKRKAERVSSPPTGTVTFLFTDIEGSTRMWQQDAPAMQLALSRHDRILRDVIEEHGGYVFKTAGDAFCAAFPTAPEALEAALFAQLALLEEEWSVEGDVRVRMALHTGVAEERNADYFGPSVNRVARLLSAGHGGQVLLSAATHEMVRDQLPAGVSLLDLGERQLKDLFRPERVFQLIAPGLPSEFPPLKTLEGRPNNLPLQPTPLVGREREVAEIADRVRSEEARLLTLTGPGGTGKTRLALQAAADLLDEFSDGAFFVALAPITDPELAASAIAGPLGVKESGDQPLEVSLKAYLRDKHLLLVLDNFEQVLEGAPLVGDLLGACPKLKVLATSRIPLRLYGEQEYPVSPLALPDPRVLPPLEVLTQYEAVRLFVERARAIEPHFEVTNESAPAVAEICARLDGLPLAIELAASRVRILPPQKMLQRLGNRLKLLKGGARDLPTRQQTLSGTIDWSHDLLDEGEKALFGRLSVFAGGRTLEAIEEICDPEGDLEVDPLDGVESLLEKSLLRQVEGPNGEPRFVMLETVHEYAREKLEESGEAEDVKRAHAEYFLALAEEADVELKGPDQLEWLDRLEAEHDNMRTALGWALESGETELALRLAGSLWWFWLVRGHLSEGRRWLEEALAKDGRAAISVHAKALTGAGRLASEQGDLERATALLEESVRLFRGLGDEGGLADAVDNLGIAAAYQGNLEQATTFFEESLSLFRKAGDRWGVAEALNNLGATAVHLNGPDRVVPLHEEALRLRRELGDKRGIMMSHGNLGVAASEEYDYECAKAHHEETLRMARELKDRYFIASALGNLGEDAYNQDDLERAESLLAESLVLSHELGDMRLIHGVLGNLASIAGSRGNAARAVRLFGAAKAILEGTGMHLADLENPSFGEHLRAARSQMNEEAWKKAWEEGRAMTVEETVSYAAGD
jgi:predicted ATPase/class 3 adenylate cyclase